VIFAQATGTGPYKLFTVILSMVKGTAMVGREYAPAWTYHWKFSVRFLNEDLTVGHRGLRGVVTRHGVVLELRETSQDAVDGQLAEWTCIKSGGGLP